jgi:hypothetical protein
MQIARWIGETLITEVDGTADAMLVLVLTAFVVWQIAKQQDTSLTIEDSAELFKQSLLRLERDNRKQRTRKLRH